MTKTTKTLLLIDDSVSFCERIQNEGEDRNWTVLATAELSEIRPWLDGHQPDVVLLDWQLPGKKRNDYVQLLKTKELTTRTLLLSGTFDEERKKFIAQNGLAGVRLKPLDMAHFEEAVALPSSAQTSPVAASESLDLKAVLDDLPLAANILDANLTPIWSNVGADREPLTPEHRLIAHWLKAEMNDAAPKATRRIDWDGEKKVFLESRLYPLNDGNYWLARDWRSEGDRPHDHELLNLDDQTDRTTWLQAVARLLAQRYAISRFRVYKVAQLRHCAAYESADERLMIPLFQSGGGFATTAEAWCGTGFLASANKNTNAIFQASYQPAPELVNDSSPRSGCDSIQYSLGGTERIQFPVKDRNGKIVALFALDRRLDHKADITDKFDKEVVAIADRMANDAKVLDATQWSLMQGLVKDIGHRLGKWLSDGEEKRRHTWHEKISKTLKDVFANPKNSPEMTYDGLSQVCQKLVEEWEDKGEEKVSGRILGTTCWSGGERPHAISSWHLILETADRHWQAVAGWGQDFNDCRQCGSRQIQEPHNIAFKASPWEAVVIQDHKEWIKAAAPVLCICDHRNQCHDIGSWLAVPIMVGQKRALMVVHSPHPYYFTEFRSQLMGYAAKRLLPLLAAALREVRARTTFAVAVMHEVKNDAHAALLLLNDMQQSAQPKSWGSALAEVRHHLEGLELLGQDTLNLFRVGLGAHNVGCQPDDKDTTVNLQEFFAGVIFGWEILYEETQVCLNLSEDLATQRVTIQRPLAFKRVLRALLHNAFRHGRDWVSVQVLINRGGNHGVQKLKVTVSNPFPKEVADALTEQDDLMAATTSSSPLTRGHMGLAVSKQLCADAGGTLEDLNISVVDDEEIAQANVTLYWPVSLATLSDEDTP